MKALGERIALTLRAGGHAEEELYVLSVDGEEGLSRPYQFDVTFHPASGAPLDLAGFLRNEAVLTLRRPTGEERIAHGECVQVALAGMAAQVPIYRLRIGPKLLRLAHAAQRRIFQEKNVPDVVEEVLRPYGIDVERSLSASYQIREYVTQYGETDLAFVTRLLAEEGIWYRFDHADGGHGLVLADAPAALAPASAPVPLRTGGEQGDGAEHVHRLEAGHAFRSSKATVLDFDFESPAVDLTGAAGQGGHEVYAYPAGYRAAGDARRIATLRLEERQVKAATYRGAGNALAFLPGAKVEVEDGPALGVVRVTHRASQQRAAGETDKGARYENAFQAIDADRPYRPPVPPRPRVGVQTATITGASGEEIHPDRHGRVKVQFHWDREGQRDDRSSCWVRVAQAWAGAGMGASRIPRLGQEVLVRWLEGDPDRPLVTGAVFNGENAPPVQLPAEKTRSAFRTSSSTGGTGWNELTFEDAAGSEEIFAHAQKDWNTVVKAARTEIVHHEAALEVGGDRARTITGGQTHIVLQDLAEKIDGNAALAVAGSRSELVATAQDESVGATRTVTVAGNRAVSVAAASVETVVLGAALSIGGAYAVSVGGAINHAVGGLKHTAVGGAAVEVVGAHREERIGKRRSSRTMGDAEIEVKAGATLLTGKDADEEVTGNVGIEVKGNLAILCQDGEIEADQITVVVQGKAALLLKKSGDARFAGRAITIDAGGGKVTVKGAKAKMVRGSPPSSGSATVAALHDLDPANKTVKVTFRDKKGEPALAGLRYKLKTPSGNRDGEVSASGLLSEGDLQPGKCELELVDLDKD
jgi:type VI secretion system secreted protein VgrG